MRIRTSLLRLATVCLLGSWVFLAGVCDVHGDGKIDNSALIPKVVPDSDVEMEGMSPDWVKTLIMAECRIETATPEGTFASATRMLDHYAEMGVNGIWIDPIWERGSKGNGYVNFGPATIEPLLTGAKTADESFAVVKKFVDEAHRRNIRVIFDIIVWGTRKDAPLVTEHPEFYRKVNGEFWQVWGGYGFDWDSQDSEGLKRWYKDAAVQFIEKTGADGFRVDLAPNTSGYFFKEIRDALYSEGHKIMIVSEIDNRRSDTFDFEQVGVTGWTEEPDVSTAEKFLAQKQKFPTHNDYLFRANLVDAIKTGSGIGNATLQQEGRGASFRFYTSNLLDHDDPAPFVTGNRVRFAYSSILAPFIPVWWIGEEWNNPRLQLPDGDGVMYFNAIDWSQLDQPDNRAFYEDTKKYIRIRRSYPEIFNNFPDSTRKANIAKLDTNKNGTPNNLQAYTRFADGKAVLIVPNYGAGGSAHFDITPDLTAIGLDPAFTYKITDLITGTVLNSKIGGNPDGNSFSVEIAGDHLGVYLLEQE